jgi:hypothetical protein
VRGEIPAGGWWQHPFKGGPVGCSGGGAGESGDVWGVAGERGAGMAENDLGSRRAQAAALPRCSDSWPRSTVCAV